MRKFWDLEKVTQRVTKSPKLNKSRQKFLAQDFDTKLFLLRWFNYCFFFGLDKRITNFFHILMKHCFKNSFWRYKSNFKFENISNKSTLYILSQNLLTFYTILCKRLVLFVYCISKLSHFLMQNLKLCKFGIATITIHQKWRSVCVDENEELSWRYHIRAQTTYTQIYLWFRLRKTAITLFCTLSLSLSHTHTHARHTQGVNDIKAATGILLCVWCCM